MADEDNVNNTFNIEKDKIAKNEIPKDLKAQNWKISEEEIKGNAAIRFYDLLINPKSEPKKKEVIKESLKLFPEPEKSKELEIDL